MTDQPINTNQPITQSTNYRKFDIHDRIFNFVLQVLKLLKFVPRTIENQTITNQLIRSVTSIGANDQEADGVGTKKDFIHCYTIVRKESKETLYWLKLLRELNPSLINKINLLLAEDQEIVNIISKIISNSINR